MRGTELPPFVSPMLAKRAVPFDSDDYLFEVKWDGARGTALVGAGAYRLFSRHQVDITDCFPELAFLQKLPAGTVLDGEVVVLQHGKPDFSLLLSRLGTRGELKTRVRARTTPATYVAFDQLYDDYNSMLRWPLWRRREQLAQTVRGVAERGLVFSDGVRASGKALFREVAERGLEGVVAKRLESRYVPGSRTDAWLKIKCDQGVSASRV